MLLGGYYLFDKYFEAGEEVVGGLMEMDMAAECSSLDCEFGESGIIRMASEKGWMLTERAGGSDRLKFTVALRASAVDELEELLLHISTPGDSLYGQHLSVSEVNEMARPSDESISTVLEWLDAEMSNYHDAGFIIKSMTVQEVESLLNVEYYIFTNADGHQITRLNEGYTVPENLQ